MSRKNFIILITIFSAIVLVFGVAFFYVSKQKSAIGQPVTFKDFIPFNLATKTAPPAAQPAPAPATTPTSPTAEAPIPKLRKISDLEIAGAAAVKEERVKEAAPLPPIDPNAPPVLAFSKNLQMGDDGQDVKDLQVFLNENVQSKDAVTTKSTQVASSGSGSPGNETTHFGPATKAAVIVFQEKLATDILKPQNLTAGTGIVDEKTRAKIHDLQALIPQKETALAVRYVERATGNVYEKFIDRLEEKKVSTTIIPKIHDAIFGNIGQSVILRYLDDDNKTIETFSGVLPPETTGGDSLPEMKGGFFPQNINDAVLSPDTSKIFYISKFENNVLGTTVNLDGTKKSQIFNSPFSEWNPQWVNARIIALNTKPSSSVPGYLYVLDTQTKDFNKILGGIDGLTSLYTPSGKKILYSKTSPSGNSFVLSLYDTDTKTSADLGIKTLPEKCVWSKDSITAYCAVPHSLTLGEYPDVWYQGLASFADSIWKINTKTNVFNILSDITQESGAQIDGTKLFLDADENYLFFINKIDSILWSLKISQ